jgi:hypothetical protein
MEDRVKYLKAPRNTEITKIPSYDEAVKFSFQEEIPKIPENELGFKYLKVPKIPKNS